MLLMILLLAWIIPHQRAALTFTEAEVAFLFPAPISRRGLIHFKLLRSQTAILFTTLLLTLVSSRFGGHAWIHAAGWWLILSTLNLHFLGSSFALTMLLDRGISNWQRRLGILALVLVLAGVVIVWGRQTMPAFDLARFDNLAGRQGLRPTSPDRRPRALFAVSVSAGGPALPGPERARLSLRARAGPAADAAALLRGSCARTSRSRKPRWRPRRSWRRRWPPSAPATGRRRGSSPGASARRSRCDPPARPPSRLLWKNLISAGQAFTLRIWISLAVFALCASVGVGQAPAARACARRLA